MTRAKKTDLVLDGNEVKLRLTAERAKTKQHVHVDWVRFTCNLRNAPTPTIEDLFPLFEGARWSDDIPHIERGKRLAELLRELPDADFAASAQAKALAEQACEALGPDFSVFPEIRKGHDFYRFRWSIVRNDVECGWVGYLSSGDSPRQHAQAKTIHCNLYGTACTFAQHGFNHRLAAIVERTEATLTRVDLALDFFDGFTGGMDRVQGDYKAGLMDHHGRKPSCNQVGDWCNGRARSFYFGSKEAGKQTNVYEKGHQLFGPKDDSPWLRCELRYGNKLRVLSADMLRRPSDFFAGASDWHAAMLREAGAQAAPEPVRTTQRLAAETICAEVKRNVQWLMDTAAPSIALCFEHLGNTNFIEEILFNKKAPGRLQRFTKQEISGAFDRAFHRVLAPGRGRSGMQPS
ncbi:replication initiation factor domain-containing protein [Acidovorax sp.]|uniref:replication initiation factor domain-containing protein n=1 Tax=Acidovorax sp. TaxID=1872122 RepID=UPI0025B8D7EB|nr:replication initiation factor domain-containing protein [Acidovorax sp.]MBW8465943.1 replication initiation factor domain-containing protein [Acidovorax sp.]